MSDDPMAGGFSEEEVTLLRSYGNDRPFQPGAYLYREGDKATSCFIILEGQVQVHKEIDGQQKVMAELGAGATVGQIALVDGTPCRASVKTTSHTTALQITRGEYRKMLATLAPAALQFQRRVAISGIRQLRDTTRELARLAALLEQDEAEAEAAAAFDALTSRSQQGAARARAALSEWELDAARILSI